ncbi:hypothetical protein [Gulosibacter sp. 10]|uniref:hypothetical protein n=1 Tax=Gulosibacter sp. 10 TaxID=1255570 RepID=UPI00097ED3D4|nr:hypothetical protein [Gulosibacter sp. 10]SJM65459.1 Cell division protein FtsL [Gulosibacter sp. 10]
MSAATRIAPAREQPTRTTETGGARPRLRLVEGLRGVARISQRGVWVALGLIAIAFVVQLWLSSVIVEDAYRADTLEQQHIELEREHTAALEQANAAASPQHLASEATELGMVPAGGSAFLDLDSNSVVSDGASTAPLSAVEPDLVGNAVLDPEAELREDAGASEENPAQPAVPSEFEMDSPSTR